MAFGVPLFNTVNRRSFVQFLLINLGITAGARSLLRGLQCLRTNILNLRWNELVKASMTRLRDVADNVPSLLRSD